MYPQEFKKAESPYYCEAGRSVKDTERISFPNLLRGDLKSSTPLNKLSEIGFPNDCPSS